MARSLFFKTYLVLVSYALVSSALVQTENLGQLNLQPGFAARLYTTSLRSPEDFDNRPDYLKNREFLSDGKLISQNIVTSFDSEWLNCYNNDMFGLFRDQSNVILEMRGYFRSPADGIFSISVGMDTVSDVYGNYFSQFNRGYWIIKNSVSLNQTANGFVCSYDSSGVNYTGIETSYDCLTYCIPPLPRAGSVLVAKDQYYPVVFYTYLSGDVFSATWSFGIDSYGDSPIEGFFFNDVNDDFDADDENLNAGFPEACPQFHEEIFSSHVFIEPSTIYTNGCPVTSTSSLVPFSSTLSSSSVITSSTQSSSSLSSSSSNQIKSVTSDSMVSSSESQISSFSSSTLSIISSAPSSSNSGVSQSSSDGYSTYSSVHSQSTQTVSNSTSETSTASDILSFNSIESSSSTSAGGEPIYSANNTISNLQTHGPTSKPTVMKSSSSVNAAASKNSNDFSTAAVTKSETDTYTTTTCPEAEHKRSKNTAYSSLLVSNLQPELTGSEAVLLGTQATTNDGVIKITAGPSGRTNTYFECTSCANLQENGSGISEAESKSTGNSFSSTNQVEHAESATVTTYLSTSSLLIPNSQSTTAVVQTFSDEGCLSRYQPLLLGITILMTFI